MRDKPIQVFSEIGPLETVMLHRPGRELENLMPDFLDRLLFDDIPYLADAQAEHDHFAAVLREQGVEVLYLEELVAEALDHAEAREEFVDDWLVEARLIPGSGTYRAVREDLLARKDTLDLVLKSMEGYTKHELKVRDRGSLVDRMDSAYPFLVDPMPNLYFARDPFATMGHGVSLNHMYSDTRNRETLYGKYIFTYHPIYGQGQVELYYDRKETSRIEGGDELVLSASTLAVGLSQRTGARAVEKLAKRLFKETAYDCILAFQIANNRKFMHLDTVFTMVDVDKFTIHPEITGDLQVFALRPGKAGSLAVKEMTAPLQDVLAQALDLAEVELIPCAGGDPVAAAREQWNDGSNTLAIAPGEVVVYDRNIKTNALLKKAGLKVHEIPGAELVRGRGGPRCMSMPFCRRPY